MSGVKGSHPYDINITSADVDAHAAYLFGPADTRDVVWWVDCPALVDAIGEDVGTTGDFDDWLGERLTLTAPCGHRRHRVTGTPDHFSAVGQADAP